MVFRGRPSRGCECCRKARTKCDEGRPSCSRCLRLNRSCSGYRKLDSLIICNETEQTKFKCLRQDLRSSTRLARLDVNLSLVSCDEDMAIWRFYSTIMASLSRSDHAYYLHSELPKLYTRSYKGSALRLSTQAIAYADASKYCGLKTRYAQSLYSQAISAMNLALQDSRKAIADETLYAVLLLCGYETITCSSARLAGWTAHVSGAAAMLIYRSTQTSWRPFAARMYHFARRSIILYHIQSCTPIDPLFSGTEGTAPPDDNDEDKLFSLMAILPEIQQCLERLVNEPTTTYSKDVQDFLFMAKALDRRLLNWEYNLPSARAFKTARNLPVVGSTNLRVEFVPKHGHKFQDIYTARLWNLYRVSRIILYSAMIRLSTSLPLNKQPVEPAMVMDTMQVNVLALVNDICATVPFLTGKDLLKEGMSNVDHFSASACKEPPKAHINQHHDQHGRHSLLWPLYVISSITFVPDSQRRWMREQIRSMGEAGDPLAVRLADSQSQTLVGRPEIFAFDCV